MSGPTKEELQALLKGDASDYIQRSPIVAECRHCGAVGFDAYDVFHRASCPLVVEPA